MMHNEIETLNVLLKAHYAPDGGWREGYIEEPKVSPVIQSMANKKWIKYVCPPNTGSYVMRLTKEGEIVARQIGLRH